MFLLSKEGSLLLLIGIGLLLSAVPPSGAIKCYECAGADCDKDPVPEKPCPDDVKFCRWSMNARACGLADGSVKLGCTKNTDGNEVCHCDKDLCNTEDISEEMKEDKGEGGSTSGGGSTAGTLLVIILGNLVTARGILPGARNME